MISLSLALVSLIAGVLTILAPCVLPVLPVILAGSVGERGKWYPYIVTGSLALSIVVFTVLLKASTFLIDVPPIFWKYLSGIILLALGLVYIFPHTWTQISSRVFGSRANSSLDHAQDIESSTTRGIITGAVLGPVFSTCSPTYTLLLATVFPVSFFSGVFYIFIYALGLSLVLLAIAVFGVSLVKKLKVFADENGIFRKVLGLILAVVGLLIITGIDKKIETYLVTHYDFTKIETSIIDIFTPSHTDHMNTTKQTDNPQSRVLGTAPVQKESIQAKAYFAGGCFWCMEGIFEAQTGVTAAISGYAGGTEATANYEVVTAGTSDHREAVEVIYDPSVISYATLVDLYFTQIDPTQADGQFADTGYRYTTAILYNTDDEKKIAETAIATLSASKKFDKPIAVKVEPRTTFFMAEEYHQDYYKKSSLRYNLYAEGSGRKGYIKENSQVGATLSATEVVQKSQYRPYDEGELMTLTGSRILLFFHADWCPTCRNFEKQISEIALPKDVIILKVNYDDSSKLKQKYAVLSQSTFVQIDSSGNMYKRWLGKSDLSDILSDLASQSEILSKKLTPLQFQVTQMGGTETPFDNAYWDKKDPGIYVDIVDGTPLFSSTDKFDSGTGWPSFSRPIGDNMLSEHIDTKLRQNRREIKSTGGSHLGHVFNDGPSEEGGLRYCINSAALRFVPVADLDKEGYEEYLSLFEKK